MIRLATPDDIPAMVRHTQAFFSDHPLHGSYDPDVMREDLEAQFGAPESYFHLVSGTGSIGVVSGHFPGCVGDRASEIWWWDEGGRGMDLLAAAEQEAKRRGAVVFQMASEIAARGEVVARLLQRRGYQREEIVMMRAL